MTKKKELSPSNDIGSSAIDGQEGTSKFGESFYLDIESEDAVTSDEVSHPAGTPLVLGVVKTSGMGQQIGRLGVENVPINEELTVSETSSRAYPNKPLYLLATPEAAE